MPITASCGNCGKSYQAPDHMAGKRVRCKHCGEVFRIDSSDSALESGLPDLNELERSFAGEEMGTSSSTAVDGPTVDAKGKVRIDRAANVDDIALSGGVANALRSNYRYRYPGAKQVDQFLPWFLVIITGFVLTRASLNGYNAQLEGEAPSIGVAISRLAFIVAAYLILVWPVSHIALRMATTRLRMSVPRNPAWRSFAAFTPVALLGAGLFIFSGGEVVALILGLILGTATAIGAVILFFRLFPAEIPVAATYSGIGAMASGLFAAAVIFSINLIGAAVASYEKSPKLFVSPIAIGLPWVEKPAAPQPQPRPTNNNTAAASGTPPIATTSPVVTPTPEVPVPQPPPTLATIAIPETGETPLISKIEVTPIQSGFDRVLLPPIPSNAIGVIRYANNGTLECWNSADWQRPGSRPARGISYHDIGVAMNTAADLVVRISTVPVDRIEQLPLGDTRIMPPIDLKAGNVRRTIGFVSENDLLVRVFNGDNVRIERYRMDQAGGRLVNEPSPLLTYRVTTSPREDAGAGVPLVVDEAPTTLRVLPDGSGVIVAGRDMANDSAPVLAVYRFNTPSRPTTIRRIAWADSRTFRPLGLATHLDRRAALLLDAAGEAYLTVWELDAMIAGAMMTGQSGALLDRKIGTIPSLRPGSWDERQSDPILWLDERTLLIYGNTLLDAQTGIRIGTLGMRDVVGQFAQPDGSILLVTQQAGLNTLVKVTLDRNAIGTVRR